MIRMKNRKALTLGLSIMGAFVIALLSAYLTFRYMDASEERRIKSHLGEDYSLLVKIEHTFTTKYFLSNGETIVIDGEDISEIDEP